MARLLNRVWHLTATTGTGAIALGAAKSDFYATVTEAGGVDGETYAYVIEDGDDFEEGIGQWFDDGTLTRDVVRHSKIGGTSGTTKLTLSGSATVFLSPMREDLVVKDDVWIFPDDMVGATDTARLQAAFNLAIAQVRPIYLGWQEYLITETLRIEDPGFLSNNICGLLIRSDGASIKFMDGGSDQRAIIATENFLDSGDFLVGPFWIDGELTLDGNGVARDGLVALSYFHHLTGRVVIQGCTRHGYLVPSFLDDGTLHTQMGTIGQVVNEVHCIGNGDHGVYIDTCADFFLKGASFDSGVRNIYAGVVGARVCWSSFWAIGHSHPTATESARFFGVTQTWFDGSQFGSDEAGIDAVVFDVDGTVDVRNITVQGGRCRFRFAHADGFYKRATIQHSYLESQATGGSWLVCDTDDAAAILYSVHNLFAGDITADVGYEWDGTADGTINAHYDLFYNGGERANGVQAAGTWPTFVEGGTTTFLALTDTPSSYSGQALKVVRVNAGATALEFATASGGGLTAVVDDTAPVLGGDLDANGMDIFSADFLGANTLEIAGRGAFGVPLSTVTAFSTPNLFFYGEIGGGVWANDQYGPSATFVKSRHGTVGSQTILQNGDGLGAFSFQGSDGTQYCVGAIFEAAIDGTPGVNDLPTKMNFKVTRDGQSFPDVGFTIFSTGIVTATTGFAVGDQPVPGLLFRMLQAAANGTNGNSAQDWFPSNGDVALDADSTYMFEGFFHSTRSAGTTSHTTGFGFAGGTATLDFFRAIVEVKPGDAVATGAPTFAYYNTTAMQTALKAASISATEVVMAWVRGVLRTDGSGGTFSPQFIYSAAPGGAPAVQPGTYFALRKVGNDTITQSGTWT